MREDKRDLFARLLAFEPANLELAAAALMDVDAIVGETLAQASTSICAMIFFGLYIILDSSCTQTWLARICRLGFRE